ncbi:hypothetical protein L841_2310 [Mycobacterium sp. MAC_080597_8934]|nr:hypothetical protein L841_2310 [Mycobacterium sp. MAC_080597_8934]
MWDSGGMKHGSDSGFDGGFDDFDRNKSRPVLITAAAPSYEEQHRARVRKYLTLMAFRIPALILAAVAYGAWHNGLISLAIVAASIPLPWMAVLIANDRPPRSPDEPAGSTTPAAAPRCFPAPSRRRWSRRQLRRRGGNRAGGTESIGTARRFTERAAGAHFSGHSQVGDTFLHVNTCEMGNRRELRRLVCR